PALMCDKPTVVSGTEGQMFDFICEYPSDSKNNTKHFCCLDIDESFGQVVRTSKHNEWTRKGRVSLYDNTTAGYFIVRLDKLYLNDSGKYHCGDFGSSDRIMKIHLLSWGCWAVHEVWPETPTCSSQVPHWTVLSLEVRQPVLVSGS
uniref:Ig-like domain-containing protein n=1 Tax=Poecilia latipinna TaxID=48699 RepID=A0A3B3TMZ7_9TELE